MSALSTTADLFFARTCLDPQATSRIVASALEGADDGELYLEYRQSEAVALEDGRIRSANFDVTQGFGLRAVSGETTGYAHTDILSQEALERAAGTVRAVHLGSGGRCAIGPTGCQKVLYTDANPLSLTSFEDKVALLSRIDAYARARDPRVRQVMASVAGSWQAVRIVRSDGVAADIRPMVRLSVTVLVGQGERLETGSHGLGGRYDYQHLLAEETWKGAVDEAVRQALVNLDSIPAPAGETTVVLGPGWPGVLLHEAVGHGLEGDFNRKGSSVFSTLMGQRVAAPGVTVVDDGTLSDRRGSLVIDDEGTPTSRTVLIEDGILKGYLFDRLNARLMGTVSTGNGRRESYAHLPIPRMTNTFMQGGDKDPAEIISSVKTGLYARSFGGGQVDIVSGKFVFSCTEAYRIENGVLGAPVKGATLIGSGAESLKKISMIGNDLALDPGVGTCGKDGQGVPVGVGQPTVRLDGVTVGGTGA